MSNSSAIANSHTLQLTTVDVPLLPDLRLHRLASISQLTRRWYATAHNNGAPPPPTPPPGTTVSASAILGLRASELDFHSTLDCLSQSQSYVTTDGQSTSLSWCKSPTWGSRQNFITVRQLRVCWCGGPSLTKDGSVVYNSGWPSPGQ
jgi:hypothetical protein